MDNFPGLGNDSVTNHLNYELVRKHASKSGGGGGKPPKRPPDNSGCASCLLLFVAIPALLSILIR